MSLNGAEIVVISVGSVILIAIIYIFKISSIRPPLYKRKTTSRIIRASNSNVYAEKGKPKYQIESEILVEGIGSISICCNQTARLGEQYCQCGRAVPQKLLNYYSPTSTN